MKQSVFITILTVLAFAIAYAIFVYILGNPANFSNGELRTVPIPGNILANIYTGGPLVVLLICTFNYGRCNYFRKNVFS